MNDQQQSRADALTGQHVHALMMAQSASCTCLTKTPDPQYHDAACRYRLLAEVIDFIEHRSSQPAAAPIGPRWIAFTEAIPPVQENGRGDRARRKVLVTNNINARDAFGDPSHVWIGSPVHDEDDGWCVPDGGKFLTHWMDPFAVSVPAPTDERAAEPLDGDRDHWQRLYLQERECRQQWQARAAASPAARFPGYTPEMGTAGQAYLESVVGRDPELPIFWNSLWDAMVAAAPQPEQADAPDDSRDAKDARYFRWLCAHPDWRFIEALCQKFVAESQVEFYTKLSAEIERRMKHGANKGKKRLPDGSLAFQQAAAEAHADAPAELRYATQLAVSLWRQHFDVSAPNWKPLPDLMGVLTQIDNMTCGLIKADAPAEPFPYQKTFNAIAAATSIVGGHVSISVKAFQDAFGDAPAEARTDALALLMERDAWRNAMQGLCREWFTKPDDAAAHLRALLAPTQQPSGDTTGWLQSGSLLYRLTDERHPQNCDEISVTMANGSRNDVDRAARASEILALLTVAQQPSGEVTGWKLAMRVLQSDLYPQLDDAERAECDALARTNPYAARAQGDSHE
ncbi:hypothetical protein [Burkholderia cenocepacia]|uniref:hypothetical protein n=1 Tax=Burkholderia cenocepacia TaxID=95486 RepID=UPI001CF3844B|nr:hypothetical protein [Burkholderia cenocepacia]MCA8237698.1 hypothetical protein [Burkholderia cenocepacia]